MRLTQLLVVSLLVGGYLAGNMQGVTLHSPLLHRLLYIFSHAHPLHLLLNGWGICSLLRSLSRAFPSFAVLLAGVASAVFSTYVTATMLPTVGASGVLFFLLGCDLVLRWGACYFPIDPRKMELYSLYLLALFCITSPLPMVNTWLHIVNFCFGGLSALLWLLYRTNRRS